MTKCMIFPWLAIIVLLAGCGKRPAESDSIVERQNPMQQNDKTRPESGSSGRLADSAARAGADYFPLASASRWEYDVEIQGPGGTSQKLTAVKSVTGQRQIGAHQYDRIVTQVSGGSLRVPDQFYRLDDDGVKAAVQGAEGKELLLLPSDPRSLTSWSGEAEPAIAGFSGKAAVDQEFQHRDRRYSGCVTVSVTMTIVEKSVFGRRETPVQLQRCYAPGIGMVRELRIVGEEGKSNYMKSDCKLSGFQIGP